MNPSVAKVFHGPRQGENQDHAVDVVDYVQNPGGQLLVLGVGELGGELVAQSQVAGYEDPEKFRRSLDRTFLKIVA